MKISCADVIRFPHSFMVGGAAALILAVLHAPNASAVVITVGPSQFDVVSTNTTFNAIQATLESQPWWNNFSLAQNFAGAYRAAVFPRTIPGSDFTAFAYSIDSFNSAAFRFVDPYGLFAPFESGESRTANVNFFTATPVSPSSVPGPLPLLGAASAFACSRKLRQRIRASRTNPLITGPSST